MAIKRRLNVGVVDFIHPADDAIDEKETDLKKYRETWDQNHIVLKEGVVPTIFKLNFSINWSKHRAIKNSTLGISDDGKAAFMLGNHSAQLVRSILVDVVNPPGMTDQEKVPFKMNKKTGLVDDDTMGELENLGVVDDIYSFYNTVKEDNELLKKN